MSAPAAVIEKATAFVDWLDQDEDDTWEAFFDESMDPPVGFYPDPLPEPPF